MTAVDQQTFPIKESYPRFFLDKPQKMPYLECPQLTLYSICSNKKNNSPKKKILDM